MLRSIFPPEFTNLETNRYNKVVKDTVGDIVKLEKSPERIVVYAPMTWHYLTVAETDKYLIKIAPYQRKEFINSPLIKIFKTLDEIPISFQIYNTTLQSSVEETISLNPDLIFNWDYLSDVFELIKYDRIYKIKRDGGEKENLFYLLGDLTEKYQRVETIINRYYRINNDIKSKIPSNINDVSFIVIDNTNFSLWKDYNTKRFNEITRDVSGLNVAKVESLQNGILNIESIINLNPDVIYINPYVLVNRVIDVKTLYEDKRLQGLKAINSRRVYHMPATGSRIEGPIDEPLFKIWFFLTLHPEYKSSFDLRKEIRDLYFVTYGYLMTEEDIDLWLRLKENSISYNYSHLFKS
jgi:iron complex transport system substrate-binding protein